ncbi:uncharacterized protein Tco025E_10195, partial [Trypanosoma conorhini]
MPLHGAVPRALDAHQGPQLLRSEARRVVRATARVRDADHLRPQLEALRDGVLRHIAGPRHEHCLPLQLLLMPLQDGLQEVDNAVARGLGAHQAPLERNA